MKKITKMKKMIKRLTKLTQKQRIFIIVIIVFLVAVILVLRTFVFHGEGQLTPTAPTDLTATDNTNKTQISLTWTDNSSNETGYKVERTGNVLKDYEVIDTISPNSTSYIDQSSNFIAGKRYYYRVKAYNNFGESSPSQIATPKRIEKTDLTIVKGEFENYNTNDNGLEIAQGWKMSSSIVSQDTQDSYILDPQYYFAKKETGQGLNGSDRQNFGVQNLKAGQTGWDYIYQNISVKGNMDFGDKIEFSIDQASAENLTNLPSGASALAFMRVRSSYSDPNDPVYKKIKIDQTTDINAQNSYSVNFDIPTLPPEATDDLKNNYSIYFEFVLWAQGDMGDVKPALNIDETHIFAKDHQNNFVYKSMEVPAPRNRNINTQMIFYDPWRDDPYQTAKNYDAIMTGSIFIDGTFLKYYNPNIKIYGYFAVGVSDFRSGSTVDPYDSNTPIGFAWAAQNHPEWFYQFPPDTSVLDPPGDHRTTNVYKPKDGEVYGYRKYMPDGVTPINFVYSSEYQTQYFTYLNNPLYQKTWREMAVSKLSQNVFDGLFIDDLESRDFLGTKTDSVTGEKSTVIAATKYPHEVQSFAQGVIPYLRNNPIHNLDVMVNQSGGHYDSWPAKTFLNPGWDPANPGNLGSEQTYFNSNINNFSANNYSNTADIFFQEHAFMSLNWVKEDMGNVYKLDYWYKSIVDMDRVKEINENNSTNITKRIFQLSVNVDRPDDPAFNLVKDSEKSNLNRYDSGWAKFALTSYMLGTSKYSFFGVSIREPVGIDSNAYYNQVDPGFDLTVKLGDATSDREELINNYSDKSLQKRVFEKGFVLVNGSPDQNRTFKLDNNYTDDLDRLYSKDTVLTLLPHTGRVFFNTSPVNPSPNISPTTTGKKGTPTPLPKLNISPTPTTIIPPTPTETPTITDETTANPSLESTDSTTPIPETFSPSPVPSPSLTTTPAPTTAIPLITPSETISNTPNTIVSINPTNVKENKGLNWRTIVIIIVASLFGIELVLFFILRKKR